MYGLEKLGHGLTMCQEKGSIGYLQNVGPYHYTILSHSMCSNYVVVVLSLDIAHHESQKSLHDPLVPSGSGKSRTVSYCPVASQG